LPISMQDNKLIAAGSAAASRNQAMMSGRLFLNTENKALERKRSPILACFSCFGSKNSQAKNRSPRQQDGYDFEIEKK